MLVIAICYEFWCATIGLVQTRAKGREEKVLIFLLIVNWSSTIVCWLEASTFVYFSIPSLNGWTNDFQPKKASNFQRLCYEWNCLSYLNMTTIFVEFHMRQEHHHHSNQTKFSPALDEKYTKLWITSKYQTRTRRQRSTQVNQSETVAIILWGTTLIVHNLYQSIC